jgi:hypothetical protein
VLFERAADFGDRKQSKSVIGQTADTSPLIEQTTPDSGLANNPLLKEDIDIGMNPYSGSNQ